MVGRPMIMSMLVLIVLAIRRCSSSVLCLSLLNIVLSAVASAAATMCVHDASSSSGTSIPYLLFFFISRCAYGTIYRRERLKTSPMTSLKSGCS